MVNGLKSAAHIDSPDGCIGKDMPWRGYASSFFLFLVPWGTLS